MRFAVCWRMQTTALATGPRGSRHQANMIWQTLLAFCLCRSGHPARKYPNPRYLTFAPTHAAAKQSGDRQRREKGPPILSAEKGEHERAPPLCVSYPAPLRATLRAPPSKWAIGAFFPESPCRYAFFGTFFRFERKYCPLGAAAPPSAPESARQAPAAGGVCPRAHQRTFLGANNRRGSHCRALRLLFA